MARKAWNANKTHCPNGHLLAGRNLFLQTNKKGWTFRKCRECRKMWAKNSKRRMRQRQKPRCPSCNEGINAKWRFCAWCGATVEERVVKLGKAAGGVTMTTEDELRTALRSAINERDQFWKQRDALARAIGAAIRMMELGNQLSALELLKSVADERRPTEWDNLLDWQADQARKMMGG